jgi:hypothetical protein
MTIVKTAPIKTSSPAVLNIFTFRWSPVRLRDLQKKTAETTAKTQAITKVTISIRTRYINRP